MSRLANSSDKTIQDRLEQRRASIGGGGGRGGWRGRDLLCCASSDPFPHIPQHIIDPIRVWRITLDWCDSFGERQRERETERDRERQRETERDRERHRQREASDAAKVQWADQRSHPLSYSALEISLARSWIDSRHKCHCLQEKERGWERSREIDRERERETERERQRQRRRERERDRDRERERDREKERKRERERERQREKGRQRGRERSQVTPRIGGINVSISRHVFPFFFWW
jgi:hypothetical protein